MSFSILVEESRTADEHGGHGLDRMKRFLPFVRVYCVDPWFFVQPLSSG